MTNRRPCGRRRARCQIPELGVMRPSALERDFRQSLRSPAPNLQSNSLQLRQDRGATDDIAKLLPRRMPSADSSWKSFTSQPSPGFPPVLCPMIRLRASLRGGPMETFTKLFGSLLAFVYHCFDRIVILGHIPLLTPRLPQLLWIVPITPGKRGFSVTTPRRSGLARAAVCRFRPQRPLRRVDYMADWAFPVSATTPADRFGASIRRTA